MQAQGTNGLDPSVETMKCANCEKLVIVGDPYCRYCGEVFSGHWKYGLDLVLSRRQAEDGLAEK